MPEMPGEAGWGRHAAGGGPAFRLLRRVIDVREDEVRATLTAFAYFFFVLSGYFILRPIRDAVAVAAGVSKLPWLFAGTLAATLVCNPLFSALVVRFPARKFIPITYHFFAVNLLAFYASMRVTSGDSGGTSASDVWVGRAFFVWTSVFNLFVVSVFWCFMADVFQSEQAKRLFGFIGVGGTLGSIVGSGVTAGLAQRLGTVNLLLISVGLLEIAQLIVGRFPSPRVIGGGIGAPRGAALPNVGGDESKQDQRSTNDLGTAIGGDVWAGITGLLRSPYLLGIGAFLILYVLGSTFLYFQQTDIVGRYAATRAARTQVLAQIELAVQVLTVVTQVFLTGRIIRWLGLAATLALLPAVSMVGFAALGAVPVLSTFVVFTVLRRGSNFALTNPAMEVLFTVVTREDKYKAKSFIETFVYRAGDQIGAWTYAGLTALGFGLAGTAYAAVPLSAVWLVLGLWLGRKQAILAGRPPEIQPPTPRQSVLVTT